MAHESIVAQLVADASYRDIAGPDVLHVISRKRYDGAGLEPTNPQQLIAIGSFHITDPEHWFYEPANAIFHNWEEATRKSDRVLIAEGDQNLWGLGKTPGQAIAEHYSTVGIQCFWAETHNIPIISGEPPNYGDIGQLLLEFAPEEVLLHYGIISIPCLYRMQGSEKPSLDDYMEERVFPSYARHLGKLASTLPDAHPLHTFDFTYSNFKHLYRTHFNAEPSAGDSELNELYLRITSAHLESSNFANRPIARIAPRRRDLRYGNLGAVQANLWAQGVSSFAWRGIFHTMALDKYYDQFGQATNPPLEGWEISSRTSSGYLLRHEGKTGDVAHVWDPWDLLLA